MATLATKSDAAEAQKEGTRIATVSQQGTAQAYGGRELDDAGGITVANTKWGARSMGNGGVVS